MLIGIKLRSTLQNSGIYFLDILAIIGTGLQMQRYIESLPQPSNKQIMRKLDRIIELLEENAPNISDEDKHL